MFKLSSLLRIPYETDRHVLSLGVPSTKCPCAHDAERTGKHYHATVGSVIIGILAKFQRILGMREHGIELAKR